MCARSCSHRAEQHGLAWRQGGAGGRRAGRGAGHAEELCEVELRSSKAPPSHLDAGKMTHLEAD